MIKKRILLTGATGTMGHEGLKQLCTQKDRFDIVILALPTPKDRKILKKYKHHSNITIVWGDLTNIEDVKKALKNVDIVLHVGALVSPVADHNPELAWKVNFGGTKNIVDILRTNKYNSNTKLVYIGTIAQTGNRVAPYHWGRIGDPLTPSVFDYYALSKINAERYIIESGISHWVSLRQTGIMHEKLMDVNDGIGYHMPLDNHLEWITAYDSGRLLFNVCSDNLPDQFWGNVYNIGGGESCRYTGYEFLDKAYGTMKVDFRKFENPNWYALRNFHGQYYYDSDKLNNYLNFRTQSVDDVFASIKKHLPLKMKILKFLPVKMVKKNMKKTALKQDTPLRWISDNQVDKIKAFFGSKEQWEAIPGWDKVL